MQKLNKNEQVILEFISKNLKTDLSKVLENIGIQKRTAQRALKGLIDKELLFASKIKNMFQERVITLKKLGIKELFIKPSQRDKRLFFVLVDSPSIKMICSYFEEIE